MKKLLFACIAAAALCDAPAFAADMAVKSPPTVAPAPAVSWTGFYVGGNVGYGWKDPTVTYSPNDINAFNGTCGGVFGGTCVPATSFGIGGALGGIQAGYNWQLNQQWVVGFEADFDWSGIRGTGTSNFLLGGGPGALGAASNFQATEEIKWFGTVRGRLGFLPTNSLMVYGTGGVAYSRVDANAVLNSVATTNLATAPFSYSCNNGPSCFTGSTSQTFVGWTAGAGGEYAITKNVTLKAEYLYVNLGHGVAVNSVAVSTAGGGAPIASSFTANISTVSFNVIRAGANWKF